jgi:hypothetical protein
VDDLSADKLVLGKLSVDDLSADELSADKLPLHQKNIFFYFEKRSSLQQRWRCSCKFRSLRIGSRATIKKSGPTRNETKNVKK